MDFFRRHTLLLIGAVLFLSSRGATAINIDFNQNDLINTELTVYKCTVDNPDYSIESTNPPEARNYVDINPTTGSIYLVVAGIDVPDGSFTLIAQCIGSDDQQSQTYEITKSEENEFTPIFTHNNELTIVVSESKKGTVVLDVNATDQDLGEYGQITYELDGLHVNAIFSLNSTSGELTLTGTDFQYSVYNLTITAKTENDPHSDVSNSNVTNVTANVNFSPTFTESVYSFSVKEDDHEDLTPGFMGSVNCTDMETSTDLLMYSLEGEQSDTFSINSNGELKSLELFDYDAGTQFYQFVVVCSDGTESDEATIQIDVQPVNEHAPTIDLFVTDGPGLPYLFEDTISEDDLVASKTPNVAYYTITANDEDAGNDGILTFSLSGLNNNFKHFFAINATNGDVYYTTKFDLDAINSPGEAVTFVITACDPGDLCTSANSKSFVVLNTADELPVFAQDSQSIEEEEADVGLLTGGPLVTVSCTDNDYSTGAIKAVELYNHTFTNQTQITVTTTKSGTTITAEVYLNSVLDYEESSNYELHFRCTDLTGNAVFSNVTIEVTPVNDVAPEFTEVTYTFNVSRTAPGDEDYVVGKVTAIDSDLVVGNQVVYAIVTDTEQFSINSNGEIILEQSLSSHPTDFVVFQVEATDDNDKHKDTATVFVTIETGNYFSPEFTGETQVEDISELTPIGTSVLSVFCNDTEPGENGQVTYEIYGGNSGNAFRIDPDTGELFVNNLLILPQGEAQLTYALSLKCSDGGVPSLSDFGSAIVRVFRANMFHPDIKNDTIVSFIDEGVALDYHLVTITAEDLDMDNLMYFFTDESHPGAFIITSSSGEVRVDSDIDREKISEYTMTVVAEEIPDEFNLDPKNDSADMFIYVRDINDNSPDCGLLSTTVEISNKLKLDRTIYQLNCTDADVGNNGNITYTLEDDFGIIGIEVNGRIYLKNTLNNSNSSTFYLEVTVSDQGKEEKNQVELTILVVVSSTNDYPPSFVNLPNSINVKEDSGTFNSIFTVLAEDQDKGVHSVVRYRLLDESSFPFKLIPNTGELYITQFLDYHTQSSYVLNISAADPDFTVYSNLTINVVDVNEHTPECSSTLFTRSITEGTSPSDIQSIDLGCSDTDKGPNGDLVYEITSGNTGSVFSISDGAVELVKALDYETQEDYDLEVLVSDSGSPALSTSVTVKINVLPVNEFTPEIPQTSYEESIKEGAEIGSTVLTVEATDDDSGVHGDLKFSLSPLQTDFGITNDGRLIITGDLDRETTSSYNFKVVVQDSGTSPKTSSATIDITILDIDDNSPSFTKDLYTNSVDSDNAMLNSLVVSVNCTDPDYQDNATVSYEILSSEDAEYFNISSNGDIAISKSLLVSGIYSFGIRCSGVANPNLTDTAQVSITIAVDSNITFSRTTYDVNLLENTTTGTFVTIEATSITNSTLTYKLIEGSPTIFSIDENSGELSLVGELDYESTQSYVLEVEAKDGGTPPNSATVAVNVIVGNINDEIPVFVSPTTTISVTEEEADFLSLATYECEDGDLGEFGKVTYELSGDDSNYFKLDQTSGELLLNNPIDYEEVKSLTLQITCADGGTPASTDSIDVLISVIPVNEYTPAFSTETVPITLSESVVPPSVISLGDQLVATDNDDSPHGTVYYRIVDGNDDNTFFLSSDDGTLTLITKLDYETKPSYQLTIVADDSGGLEDPDFPVLNSTIEVEVSVTDYNDNSPMFNKNVYVGSLSELSEIDDHVEMVTLICTDKDSGNNGKTSISIISGNEDGIFEIDNSNGKVVLKKEVDFESNSFYSLTVRCSDMGSPSFHDDASLTINIEDYSEYGPLFEEQIYEFSINETEPPGSIVGQVKAVDADAGDDDDIVYSVDTVGPFAIDSDSGVITITSPLDYEDPPTSFVFNVTAVDPNDEKDVTIVAINILNVDDNKPKFAAASYYGEINENSNPGQSVFFETTFSCSDADDQADGISPTFSLVSSNSIPFSIDTEGDDTTIISNDELDSETTDRYTFTIYCFDSGNSNTSAIMTIDIQPYNDFAPEFQDTPYSTTLLENVGVDTSILQVSAVDKDKIDYNEITFGIFSGNDRGDFTIDETSGVVRVAKQLDYEEVTSYTLRISASNIVPEDDISPSLVTYTDFDITITDVNDNSPMLTSTSVYVVANSTETAGYHIADVTCEDPDSGDYGNVTLVLTNQNTHFELLSNGSIVTIGSFVPVVTLRIECSDMGDPPLTSEIDIEVVNENVNPNYPDFGVQSLSFTIYENHTIGEEIGCANATDADPPDTPSGILTYSMTLESGENHFLVNKATGCISVSTTLDYDDISSYTYKLRATDGGVPAKFDEVSVYITVLNVIFDPPQFVQSSLTRTISENIPAGALVTETLTCTDRDDDDVITYSISSGNDDDIFQVNSTTGKVVLAKPLDYEMETSHVITLRCNDSSNLYDEAVIVVTVGPVNEHTPVITETVVYADEESPVGTEITIIDYTDLDDGLDGEVTFEIVGGGYEKSFFIVNDVLYFNETLDREDNIPQYPVQIRVTDKGTILQRSSVNFVNVSLTDINDNAPVPDLMIFVAEEVNVTADIGYYVDTVRCTDIDKGVNAEISYSIEKNSLLAVDSVSGNVTVSGNLKDRSTDTIALTLTCTDKGQPSLSTDFIIQVPVLDPNEHDPVFLETSYSVTLPENYNLSVVFINVTATDQDVGLNGQVEYSLTDDFENLFFIDAATGEISLLTELDYEAVELYELEVLAIDGASDSPMRRTGSVEVSVEVTGVNEFTPECKQPIYTTIITANDTGPVLLLTCDDSDSGIDGEIDYTITPSSHSDLFNVNSTGWISIPASIPPNASIEVYEIFITVSDKGTPSKEYEVEANFIYSFENKYSPVFDNVSYTVTTSESTSVGTVVLTVSATDADPGLQGDIVYSVTGTNYFRANPQTGEIYVSEELDYEETKDISFHVVATDSDPSEPLSSNASVTISIQDVNDNSPVCDLAFYSTEIGSSLAINDTVFNLTGLCTDSDGPANAQLSYSLTPTDSFAVNATSGIIYVNGPLTAGTSTALTVTVQDSGSPSLSTSITVSVIVRFDNVESPQFDKDSYEFNITEDSDLLTSVGQVTASDGDSSASDLTYTLTTSGLSDLFYVDPQSGEIILTDQLDYETKTSYEITIKVEDSGSHDGTNKLSDTTSVTINVDNVNDNSPVLSDNGLYGVTVNKTTPIDEVVVTITCTDADLSPYAEPSISNHGFTASDVPFKLVESGSGEWEVQVASDLTTINGTVTYDVNLTCVDKGGLETTGQVFLSVPDLDAPIFNQTSYEWNLREDAESGEAFSMVMATSQDKSEVEYEIIDGNSDNLFYIHPETGVVSLSGSLDFEEQSSYALVIQATDGKQRSATVLLRVFVVDVDDHIPLVPPSAYLTLDHNKPIGYPVGSVDCVDDDYSGGNFSFSFVEASADFAIDDDGIITLTSVLDETPVYVLPVTCYDKSNPEAVSTGVVTVEITFINLYEPEFDLSVYEVSIKEDAKVDSLVVNVTATDDDIGNQGKVSYSIIDGSEDKFYIDTQTGVVSVLTALDRESEDTYALTVNAVDGGITNTTVRKTGSTTVNIHVLDVNDNNPVFTQQSYVATIITNHTVLSSVIQVHCDDSDSGVNGDFDYSIQPSHDTFIIDTNGTISLSEAQSEETVYNFYAYCTDKGSPTLSSSALVTVAVNDVELGDPVFNESSYSVELPEDQELLDVFLTVAATVNNAGVDLTYSIVSGNTGNTFFINSNTGELSLIENLDYNTLSTYTLTVRATTQTFSQKSSQVLVSVTVTDINNNEPVFVPLVFYSGSVSESDDINTPVVQVNCTDADSTDVLTYTLSGDSPANGDEYFRITDSGLVTVKQALDYETTSIYTLSVICSDGSNEAEATVRVDIDPVNEFKPVFQASVYAFTVDENSNIGDEIGYVNATDNDAGTDGEITYVIDDPEDLSPIFVDPTSGQIVLSSLLDYEVQNFYNVSVIAKDSGDSQSYVPVEITVNNLNDELPVLTPAVATYSGRVSPTDSPEGLFIEFFTCTDPDGGDTSITITSGNEQGYFKLNSFNQLVWNGTSNSLDSDIVVTIMLKCTDEANDEDTASIAIVVGKPGVEPPKFTSSSFEGTVHENATINTHVLSVTATPFLSNHTIEYSLFSFDVALPFGITSDGGAITVNGSLDYEDVDFYSFPVQAKDVEDGSISLATVDITVLDINDNIPVIQPSFITIYVKEDATTDVAYTKFSCSDADSDKNGETMFSVQGEEADTFSIAASTGSVTLKQSLDYESDLTHNVTIVCIDSGKPQLTGSATLIVRVSGVNEHAPKFDKDSYSFTSQENDEIGTSVGSVNATDEDHGTNGMFHYSINGGSGSDYFRIDENSGEIFVNNFLNASMDDSLALVVLATDNGPPSALPSDVLVTLTIEDVNEVPYFDKLSYVALIATDVAEPGDTLGTISCFDYDLGLNAELTMVISDNDLPGSVVLEGDMMGNESLTRDLVLNSTVAAGAYEVIINCSDSGTPSLSRAVSFSITVQGVNTAPVFSKTVYGLSVHEDMETGKSLLQVSASDDYNDFTYALLGGAGLGTFTIDENTGELSLAQSLDFEITESYSLTVGAIDDDELNPMTGSATIAITVVNVNDHPPTVSPPSIQSTLDEGTYTMKDLQSFTCTDIDGGSTIFSVSPNPPFEISEGGMVSFTGEADYEVATVYTVTVTCTDEAIAGGDSVMQGTATLIVSINAVNFFAPVLTSEATFNVSEGSEVSDELFKLTANDPDGRGTIGFSTSSHEDVFFLDSNGAVSLLKELDRETKDSYQLTVEITDGDTEATPKTTTETITIKIQDINDNSPTCDSTLDTISISAGTYNTSISLYNASCSDVDIGNNSLLVYSLKSDSLPEEGSYEVDSETGELTFQGTITKLSTSTVIAIVVSDSGTETTSPAEIQLILSVLTGDEPHFDPDRFSVNISESQSEGKFFSGQTLKDALKNVDDDENVQFYFSTNSSIFLVDHPTGDVFLVSSGLLDYDEGLQEYSLGIEARIGSINLEYAEAILDVFILDYNDNSPEFSLSSYNGSVIENLDSSEFDSTVIVTVAATDIDSNENSEFTFSISTVGNNFEIDENTGEITPLKSFDRETVSVYSLIVVATDKGDPAQSSSANVIIQIEDENDNAPVFPIPLYIITLPDNTKIGTVLETIKAEDLDITGSLKYDLKTDDPTLNFIDIDPEDGELRLTDEIPSDHKQFYEFKVTVNDIMFDAEVDVFIQIVTVSVMPIAWLENTADQTANIYQFLANDYNVSENSGYLIIGGNQFNHFGIIGDGILTNNVLLDRENISFYSIQVAVNDSKTSETFIVDVLVTVEDLNDNAPVFESDFYQFNISEGTYNQKTLIGSVRATDADEPNSANSRIIYEIFANSGEGVLDVEVGILNGFIFVFGNVDREFSPRYLLTIVASDAGQPVPLLDSVDVEIVLSDVNDNAPRFDIVGGVNQFVLYFVNGQPVNSEPYRIVAVTSFGDKEVAEIEFSDPDSSGEPIADLESEDLQLATPFSPLMIFTKTNVSHRLNQTTFTIVLSDGFELHDITVDGLIVVTEELIIPRSSTTTSTMAGGRATSTSTIPVLTVTPSVGRTEEFFVSPVGIAVIVVAVVLLFAICFFMIGLLCFCYQRYRMNQAKKRGRPTSVFKRVTGEKGESKEMKKNVYAYENIDTLDHPYLSPDDRQNGELYGEHNVVETEFTDQMHPYPMYPNPNYYPYQYGAPPGVPGYDDVTLSSRLHSDQDMMYDDYEEGEFIEGQGDGDEEEETSENLGFRRGPGPILNQMLDEFHKGDELLKGDKKKRISLKNLSKVTA